MNPIEQRFAHKIFNEFYKKPELFSVHLPLTDVTLIGADDFLIEHDIDSTCMATIHDHLVYDKNYYTSDRFFDDMYKLVNLAEELAKYMHSNPSLSVYEDLRNYLDDANKSLFLEKEYDTDCRSLSELIGRYENQVSDLFFCLKEYQNCVLRVNEKVDKINSYRPNSCTRKLSVLDVINKIVILVTGQEYLCHDILKSPEILLNVYDYIQFNIKHDPPRLQKEDLVLHALNMEESITKFCRRMKSEMDIDIPIRTLTSSCKRLIDNKTVTNHLLNTLYEYCKCKMSNEIDI